MPPDEVLLSEFVPLCMSGFLLSVNMEAPALHEAKLDLALSCNSSPSPEQGPPGPGHDLGLGMTLRLV